MTWPRTLAQEPINIGDAIHDPLYPCGFGLTGEQVGYADAGPGSSRLSGP
jgi:hypothetical protein